MTIKTHTESSKSELSSRGKRPFKVSTIAENKEMWKSRQPEGISDEWVALYYSIAEKLIAAQGSAPPKVVRPLPNFDRTSTPRG